MADITVRDMLDAGVHFGHRARHWNPKMAPFIYGERNQLHIIDLEQTVPLYRKTCDFVRSVAAQRGTVLFVGTKRAAQHAIRNEATRCGMPYVSHRWLGGTLTNLKTIKKSIARLEELEALEEDATRERFTKKEMLGLKREREKLLRSLGGIRDMNALPDAVFIIDLEHERIALNEARKLGIPVAAVVDTNCSPQDVDYMIPGNDDAIRAAELYARGVADAIMKGREEMPEISLGEDEFVELDESGKPIARSGRRRSRSSAPTRLRGVSRRMPRRTAAVAREREDRDSKPDEAAPVATPPAEAASASPAAEAPAAEAPAVEAPAAEAPADADASAAAAEETAPDAPAAEALPAKETAPEAPADADAPAAEMPAGADAPAAEAVPAAEASAAADEGAAADPAEEKASAPSPEKD